VAPFPRHHFWGPQSVGEPATSTKGIVTGEREASDVAAMPKLKGEAKKLAPENNKKLTTKPADDWV
jgi:hypothetical protein